MQNRRVEGWRGCSGSEGWPGTGRTAGCIPCGCGRAVLSSEDLDEKRKEKPQEGLRGWSAWPQALGSVGLFAVRVGQVSFHGGEPASQEEQKTVLLQGGGS